MRRIFPLVIIGAVLSLAIGGGLWYLRWKQHQQPSQTSPIIPIIEATPTPAATPVPAQTPTPAENQADSHIPAQTTPETNTAAVPEAIHIRGGPTAKVTLEEYGDFQCQPCGRLYPVLKDIESNYGDRLRVVFRHMPLTKHEHAQLAARAAEAAGLQGHFWEMHDLLFENAPRWTKGVDTIGESSPSRRLLSNLLAMDIEVRDVFTHYAETLHLDVDRFKKDIDSNPVKDRVNTDRTAGLKLGIDRTPTIYVNGQLIPAPSSLTSEGLHAAIDAALAGKVFVPPPTETPTVAPTLTPAPTE